MLLIKPLLSDGSDTYVRQVAIKTTLAEIVKAMPVKQGLSLIQPLLSNSDLKAKHGAEKILVQIMKTDPAVAEEVWSLIKPLLSDSSVRQAAVETLTEVVKNAPAVAEQALSLITLLLDSSESNMYASKAATKTLTEIIKQSLMLRSKLGFSLNLCCQIVIG